MKVFVLLADYGFDGSEIRSIHTSLEDAMGELTEWKPTCLVSWIHDELGGSRLVHTDTPVTPGRWTHEGKSDNDILAPSYVIEEWEVK